MDLAVYSTRRSRFKSRCSFLLTLQTGVSSYAARITENARQRTTAQKTASAINLRVNNNNNNVIIIIR